jgi:hypothetical protein
MTKSKRTPYKYKAEYVGIARKLCQDHGATDTDVAERLDVSTKTIRRWRSTHPKFHEAMQIAIGPANANVEMSLYKQTQGYWIDTEEIKVIENKVVRVPTRTFIPPSVTAGIFWTKVKMGWRENDMPKPPEGDTIEGMGIRAESTRQIARRIALILYQAENSISEVSA